ncbi:MAG: hypothetical protein M8841_07950 [marine benthic group bacterium]|jgi:hypothetical protein|nr:hypothetical protein [Gemmatimonadota bacterium]MCL7982306.1 hypothetical protein [Gemmatimonadota bacterium]MCL7991852.1 hypothetical protein [Gemmatimonadota bacterium]
MIERLHILGLTVILAVAFSPAIAVAQESLNAAEQELPPASQAANDLPTTGEVGSADTSKTLEYVSLDSPMISNLRQAADAAPVVESLQSEDDDAPASPAAGKGSGTGLGFMIAGAAALVGGLLIGGTGGNLIAAGGVALGVYGIIVYF